MTIRNLVLWSATDDVDFVRRYREEHLPLVSELPGLQHATVSTLRSREYSLLAELHFADVRTMKSAFASDAGIVLIAHTAELEAAFDVKAKSILALSALD
ncbi:EthD family reductase [Glaciibacter superstes]|uniref:EthD family reductase n=1 Tax=Glaciibacter superstes TaxID=501023 RepID=UPI0003B5548B|nr:EthD family reductase [Glaciibacter superstes]